MFTLTNIIKVFYWGSSWAAKAITCYQAGKRVHGLCTQGRALKAAEKVDVAANVIFIGFQTLEVATQFSHNAIGIDTGKTMDISALGTGVTDATRAVTTKVANNTLSFEDTLDVATTLAFRIGDNCLTRVIITPEHYGEKTESLGYFAKTVAGVLFNRNELGATGRSLANRFYHQPAVPVAAPQAVPVTAPQAVPVAAPQAVPVAAPQAVPVTAPQAVPVAAPQAVPVAAPQAVPVAAPQAVPVAAPQAAPDKDRIIVLNVYPQFLDWLNNQIEMRQFICPFSGKFIINPVHHREQQELIIEKTALIGIEHGTTFEIRGQNYTIDSFLEPVDAVLQATNIRHFTALSNRFINDRLNIEVERIIDYENLKEIPNLIQEGWPVFCSITKRPVRFAVRPKSKEVTGIFYERAALDEWEKKNPRKRPLKWPEDLPFEKNNVKPCRSVQSLIDTKLQEIAKDFRNKKPRENSNGFS